MGAIGDYESPRTIHSHERLETLLAIDAEKASKSSKKNYNSTRLKSISPKKVKMPKSSQTFDMKRNGIWYTVGIEAKR